MKQKQRLLQIGLSTIALLGHFSAQATLTPELRRGNEIIEHAVAAKRPEICVLPRHLDPADYSDKDLAKEKFLCSLEAGTNSAVVPKTNSTNPGLIFESLPSDSSHRKLAKYKLSTSCSYAPSLLAYYHVSRLLGGAGRVPPAVIRTFDLDNHLRLGEFALAHTPPGDLIHVTWASLMSQLRAGSQGSRRNLLLTDHFDQSYGALQINPQGELFYREFFNPGADNATRAANFRDKNPIAAMLRNPNPVREFVGRILNAANLQRIIQMQDASEMIILDSLLSQQDRFGNVAYTEEKYLVETSPDGQFRLHSKNKLTPEEAKRAFTVKKMLLKDNDCGVAKENIALRAQLPSLIRHLEPSTYRKLLALAERLDNPATEDFFRKETLLTAGDYERFRSNAHQLASQFKAACKAGQLFLDLDLQSHFFDQGPRSESCEL